MREALKATDYAGFRAKKSGVDLNLLEHLSERFRRGDHEHRQDPVFAIDGFSSVEHLHPNSGAISRGRPGSNAVLRRAIPGDGLRPTDLPGEPARHRDVSVGPGVEVVPHGLSRSGSALDTGRCQRIARLADLCGSGPAIDCPSSEAVRQRGSWRVTV